MNYLRKYSKSSYVDNLLLGKNNRFEHGYNSVNIAYIYTFEILNIHS